MASSWSRSIIPLFLAFSIIFSSIIYLSFHGNTNDISCIPNPKQTPISVNNMISSATNLDNMELQILVIFTWTMIFILSQLLSFSHSKPLPIIHLLLSSLITTTLASTTDLNGCSAASTTSGYSELVITNKIYACAGTIAKDSGGLYGTGHGSAAALCNSGYHVCHSSNEAESLGLTSNLCQSIGTDEGDLLFMTKETRGNDGDCISEGNGFHGSPTDDAYDDVWGCGDAHDMGYDPCGVLVHRLGNGNWDNWKISGTYDSSANNDEARAYYLTDAKSGGVLCCVDSSLPSTMQPTKNPISTSTALPILTLDALNSNVSMTSRPSHSPIIEPSTSPITASPTMELTSMPTLPPITSSPAIITCNSSLPCDVDCGADGAPESCEEATINANGATNLTVHCTEYRNCLNTIVNCGDTESCHVICQSISTTSQICMGLRLNCGSSNCKISCSNDAQSCDTIQVNQATAASFQCIGSSLACQSAPAPFTSSPTEQPTIISTINPTISPSITTPEPSLSTTSNSHIRSTSDPSTMPTVNPTAPIILTLDALDPNVSMTRSTNIDVMSTMTDSVTMIPTSAPDLEPETEEQAETKTSAETGTKLETVILIGIISLIIVCMGALAMFYIALAANSRRELERHHLSEKHRLPTDSVAVSATPIPDDYINDHNPNPAFMNVKSLSVLSPNSISVPSEPSPNSGPIVNPHHGAYDHHVIIKIQNGNPRPENIDDHENMSINASNLSIQANDNMSNMSTNGGHNMISYHDQIGSIDVDEIEIGSVRSMNTMNTDTAMARRGSGMTITTQATRAESRGIPAIETPVPVSEENQGNKVFLELVVDPEPMLEHKQNPVLHTNNMKNHELAEGFYELKDIHPGLDENGNDVRINRLIIERKEMDSDIISDQDIDAAGVMSVGSISEVQYEGFSLKRDMNRDKKKRKKKRKKSKHKHDKDKGKGRDRMKIRNKNKNKSKISLQTDNGK